MSYESVTWSRHNHARWADVKQLEPASTKEAILTAGKHEESIEGYSCEQVIEVLQDPINERVARRAPRTDKAERRLVRGKDWRVGAGYVEGYGPQSETPRLISIGKRQINAWETVVVQELGLNANTIDEGEGPLFKGWLKATVYEVETTPANELIADKEKRRPAQIPPSGTEIIAQSTGELSCKNTGTTEHPSAKISVILKVTKAKLLGEGRVSTAGSVRNTGLQSVEDKLGQVKRLLENADKISKKRLQRRADRAATRKAKKALEGSLHLDPAFSPRNEKHV